MEFHPYIKYLPALYFFFIKQFPLIALSFQEKSVRVQCTSSSRWVAVTGRTPASYFSLYCAVFCLPYYLSTKSLQFSILVSVCIRTK
jgi:hypothetical protein